VWFPAIVTPVGGVVQGKLAGEHAHTEGSSFEAFTPGTALRQVEPCLLSDFDVAMTIPHRAIVTSLRSVA